MNAPHAAPAASAPAPRTALVCGASGFIGSQIAQALRRAGWQVRAASRHSTPAVDFCRATSPADWLPLLAGVQAVVNAVGVLRDSRARPMAKLHEQAPRALFDACAASGLRRVVQISALGIQDSPTAYARTKCAADAHLLALTAAGQLDGVVLRPSLVFGPGGEGTRLFLALARLPVLLLPRPVIQAQVQPLAVWDLAEAAARLASGQQTETGLIELAGPQPLTLANYIATLRQQQPAPASAANAGAHPAPRPARQWPLPDAITRLSARLGDALPWSPWCSQAVALLQAGNTASPAPLQALLGHPATPPSRFVQAMHSRDEKTA